MRWSALLSVTAMTLAQSLPTSTTGAVAGSVLDAATGAPIRKAKITFRFKRENVRIVTTDATGLFQASNLIPGDYRITAVARGYFPLDSYTSVGPRHAVMAFAVAGGQTVSGLVVRLTPAAAISGRIVDEDDEPMGGVPVQLWSIRYREGQRELATLQDARALTDDRGMYRIAGIAPGRYYVSAFHVQAFGVAEAETNDLRYLRTFYPAATDPGVANTIQLAPGAELENINWKASKAQTVRVSGRVRDAPARYFANLVPEGILSPNDAHLQAKIGADGDFEFQEVPPGTHTLVVGGGDEAWAFRTIVVGRSGAEGLTITLNPPIRVEGRVRLEDDSTAAMSQLRVVLSPQFPVSFHSIESPVTQKGGFAWKQLIAGPYRLSVVGLPPGVYLKSIRLGGQALPDGRLLDFTSAAPQPVELQLSAKAARVAGAVVSAGSDQPVSEVTVILVPDEPERRGDLAAYLHTSTDASGRFFLQNVPPGSYHAYGVHSVRDNLFMDPMFLQPYEQIAVAVTVAEGGQANVKLSWKP